MQNSAGCILAGRLSEMNKTVLLLEAGASDNHVNIALPPAFSKLFTTDYEWNYMTEDEPEMRRKMVWPKGRVIGGSSSINAMIYVCCLVVRVYNCRFAATRRIIMNGSNWVTRDGLLKTYCHVRMCHKFIFLRF